MSDIHCLPWELLLLIFQFGQTASQEEAAYSVFSHHVASVCQHWRRLAIESPRLWTNVVVVINRDPPLLALHSCLQRSFPMPIDIHIIQNDDCGYIGVSTESARMASVMHLVVPHIERWHILSIRVFHFPTLGAAFANAFGSANALEELHLITHPHRKPDQRMEIHFQCPALHTLSLSNSDGLLDGIFFFTMPFVISMTSLRSLSVFGFSLISLTTYILDALGKLPNLTSLSLVDIGSFHTPGSLANTSLSLNTLEEVSFISSHPAAISAFFNVIYTPILDEMTITSCAMHYVSIPRRIPYLRLRAIHNFEPYQLPDCNNLDLCFMGINSSTLSAMCPEAWPYMPWPCPTLESLSIRDCPYVFSGALRRMVEARRDASAVVARITRLAVYNCSGIDLGDREWFEQNLEVFVWENPE